jgi:hypothetical protein
MTQKCKYINVCTPGAARDSSYLSSGPQNAVVRSKSIATRECLNLRIQRHHHPPLGTWRFAASKTKLHSFRRPLTSTDRDGGHRNDVEAAGPLIHNNWQESFRIVSARRTQT